MILRQGTNVQLFSLSSLLCFILFFCLHTLNKLFNSYFICFEYVWIFVLLLHFLFFMHAYYQQDSFSPSWARAGCKKTLSLIHYPCEIMFIHSVSLSVSLFVSLSLCLLLHQLLPEPLSFFFSPVSKILSSPIFLFSQRLVRRCFPLSATFGSWLWLCVASWGTNSQLRFTSSRGAMSGRNVPTGCLSLVLGCSPYAGGVSLQNTKAFPVWKRPPIPPPHLFPM